MSDASRKLVSSGSPYEREVGFSRAVRVGNIVEIAGTAPVGANAPGDMYAQTKRCLEIIAQALRDAGADVRHVTRTRVMVTDMSRWREAARAHGEMFGDARPGCTFVEVSAFIDPEWLVEIEASAVVDD
ncbi:RidA family protein [Terricaulis sp.]|uniref:RidA family protein n=1 Tax=Terricaulis sp. TaxID=2768686 RepID=UPI003783075A